MTYPTSDFPGARAETTTVEGPVIAARHGWPKETVHSSRLGVRVTGVPGACEDREGRVVVFVRERDTGHLLLTRQSADGRTWSTPAPPSATPEPIDGSPVAARAVDGRIGVFYRAPDGELRTIAQNTDGTFARSTSPGGRIWGDPLVVHNADGRIEVFMIGKGDRALWHCWTDSAGPDGFTAPALLGGGNLQAITATRDGGEGDGEDRRILIIHTNTSGSAFSLTQTAPNGPWGNFSWLCDDVNSQPVLGNILGGLPHLLYALDGTLAARSRQWNRAAPWSDVSRSTAPCVGKPAVTLLPQGRLAAFCRDDTGQVNAVFHDWDSHQDTWRNAAIHPVTDSAGTDITVQSDAQGRVVLAYGTTDPQPELSITVLGA
ncbi:hypothetical protein ABZ763_12865 [Streptomyces bacillaris]|uniref:hypothetical protein n=1 Tax=Streptomyces bacillaris TaxID=68179 RepID=UPI003460FE12